MKPVPEPILVSLPSSAQMMLIGTVAGLTFFTISTVVILCLLTEDASSIENQGSGSSEGSLFAEASMDSMAPSDS